MGIEAHHSEDLAPLFRMMNEYTRDGTPSKGRVRIPAVEFSTIHYNLCPDVGAECYCRITR
jgi:hypothetical protein